MKRFGYRLSSMSRLVFWLIKAEKDVLFLVLKQMKDCKGRVLKRRNFRTWVFVSCLIFFRYENLNASTLCSSFDYWTLAAYTYFSISLDCLLVCCAYTQACGSEFGFGCTSYCRHCHSTGSRQRYVIVLSMRKDAVPISMEPYVLAQLLLVILWLCTPRCVSSLIQLISLAGQHSLYSTWPYNHVGNI